MHRAWTGGQYSLVRLLGGSLIAVHFLERTAVADGFFASLLWMAASATSVVFALGRWERTAAAVLLVALWLTCEESSFLGHAGTWYAAAWMIAHLCLPSAPYGSLDAVGRQDPRGDWQMPQWAPAAAWALFVAHHAASGVSALASGHLLAAMVSLALAGFGLSASLRVVVWSVSLGIEVAKLFLGASDGGVWLLHLLALQPLWFPPRENLGVETVFYDGTCALCHGATRFLLSEDAEPARFRLAPLGGDAFEQRMPAGRKNDLPDSVVVVAADGAVHVRSSASLYMLDRIGGLWRLVGDIASLLPSSLLDGGYDTVARNRYRWFGRKTQACPILAGELRQRFDM
ncbi:MAG TPA: DCC1-like thiol-disulfide oxidoreductase family protein [Candidatus Binatia bacterium]|nr:DCC1-like thiol-disulfide oxidoreductase family protein [Candidatus Binatia bacterium]